MLWISDFCCCSTLRTLWKWPLHTWISSICNTQSPSKPQYWSSSPSSMEVISYYNAWPTVGYTSEYFCSKKVPQKSIKRLISQSTFHQVVSFSVPLVAWLVWKCWSITLGCIEIPQQLLDDLRWMFWNLVPAGCILLTRLNFVVLSKTSRWILGWIAMKLGTDTHGAQRMCPNDLIPWLSV